MRGWIVTGIALGIVGLAGCVDADPTQTPTAIEVPLQRTPIPSGEEPTPLLPNPQGETIQRAPPEQ